MERSRSLKKVINKDRPNTIEYKEIFDVRKLLSKPAITLYHGTKNDNLIPSFEYNNPRNDYGKGFYTTPDIELGKEWAYSSYTKGETGYIYTYELDIQELNILSFTEINSMHWIAELLANRSINTDGREALQDTINQFKEKYKIDTRDYDIIVGYRGQEKLWKKGIRGCCHRRVGIQ